jgi:hypothetical protein
MHFFFCFIQAYLQLIGKKQKMLGQSLSFVARGGGDFNVGQFKGNPIHPLNKEIVSASFQHFPICFLKSDTSVKMTQLVLERSHLFKV